MTENNSTIAAAQPLVDGIMHCAMSKCEANHTLIGTYEAMVDMLINTDLGPEDTQAQRDSDMAAIRDMYIQLKFQLDSISSLGNMEDNRDLMYTGESGVTLEELIKNGEAVAATIDSLFKNAMHMEHVFNMRMCWHIVTRSYIEGLNIKRWGTPNP